MSKLQNKIALNFILYFSIFSISFAYYVEFFLGHMPCNLCLLERVPYFLSIFIITILLIVKKYEKFILFILGIIFLFATVLSIYHVGIENGFIEESPICGVRSGLNILDKELLLEELKKSTISCKNVTFSILGLSLATINIFVSLCFFLITIRKFYYYEKK